MFCFLFFLCDGKNSSNNKLVNLLSSAIFRIMHEQLSAFKRKGLSQTIGGREPHFRNVKRRSLCYDFYHRASSEVRYVHRNKINDCSGKYEVVICRYSRSGRKTQNIDYRRTISGEINICVDDVKLVKATLGDDFDTFQKGLPFTKAKEIVLFSDRLDDTQVPYVIFKQNLEIAQGNRVYAHLSRFEKGLAVGVLKDNLTTHRVSPVQFRTLEQALAVDKQYEARSECSWLTKHKGLPPELARRVRVFLIPPPCFFFTKGDIQLFLSWTDNNQDYHELTIVGRPKT